jgi:TRAP-type C4-dicarboxylate transport system permease small subunit
MIGLFARGETALVSILRGVIGAIMLGAVGVNLANIIGRYVFSHPFIWAEEIMQFLSVWAVMLGAAVITREAAHLRMDALHHMAPPRVRQVLDLFTDVVAFAVVGYVLLQSVDMIRMLTRTVQRSVIAGVPMNVMYAAVFVGFGGSAVFLVARLVRAARPPS